MLRSQGPENWSRGRPGRRVAQWKVLPRGIRLGHAESPGKQTQNRGFQRAVIYAPELDGGLYFTSAGVQQQQNFLLERMRACAGDTRHAATGNGDAATSVIAAPYAACLSPGITTSWLRVAALRLCVRSTSAPGSTLRLRLVAPARLFHALVHAGSIRRTRWRTVRIARHAAARTPWTDARRTPPERSSLYTSHCAPS